MLCEELLVSIIVMQREVALSTQPPSALYGGTGSLYVFAA